MARVPQCYAVTAEPAAAQPDRAAHHSNREETLRQSVTALLALQLAMTLGLAVSIAVGFLLLYGFAALRAGGFGELGLTAGSAVYGGGLALLGSMLSARGVSRVGRAVMQSPELAMLPLYAGMIQRLFVVAAGMACGLVWFRLEPIYVILGWVTAHSAYVIVGLRGHCWRR